MIKQMKVLLRVKELKQEQAFRAMQAKRVQVAQAKAATERAGAAVEESRRTYGAREDAIYAEVLGTVVDSGEIDALHGRVLQLEKDHQGLKDQVERAIHVEARLEGELEVVVAGYKAAVKVRDKYTVITDDMTLTAATEAEYREEMEVEDMFSRPRRKAA